MKRVQISLPVIESTGPRIGTDLETGAKYEFGSPCPECRSRIGQGEEIVLLGGSWYHVDCLETEQIDRVWHLLAYDVAKSPGRYDSATIRAVVKNLSRMASNNERSS